MNGRMTEYKLGTRNESMKEMRRLRNADAVAQHLRI